MTSTNTTAAEKPAYYVIEFTGIDGKRYDWRTSAASRQKFSTKTAAQRWAKEMPDWQQPVVTAIYDGTVSS